MVVVTLFTRSLGGELGCDAIENVAVEILSLNRNLRLNVVSLRIRTAQRFNLNVNHPSST